jgi:ribosomal protein S12 methylthiotransferase accessory factor
MTKPIVFLGPSLPLAEAKKIIDADFRPPIKRGELLSAPLSSLVVIIDGEFQQNLSVSPKEILRLLERGSRVIGAASMGALRATELAVYGMEGYGWVYKQYQKGEIVGDDEVAVTYCPRFNTPYTVPMVNIRYWMKKLTLHGAITEVQSKAISRKLKKITFSERTVEIIVHELSAYLGYDHTEKLLNTTNGRISDIKRQDTQRLLASLASGIMIN